MKYTIEVDGLTKEFQGRKVVDNLSLQVKQGEIFGFLGPNGSGKTTSIRMMCGLLSPSAGSGRCLGYNISSESHLIKRKIAYMPQKFSLYTDLTVSENLKFMADLFDADPKQKVTQVIARLNLEDYEHTSAQKLSGGWKQRLALAACLLHEPEILFLDEPTAGVDPAARGEFWSLLHELASTGMTVLVSTHYMDEAYRCHRLGYIFDGVLLSLGTAKQIIADLNICTLKVIGDDVTRLIPEFKKLTGVSEVIAFGQELHVIGHDIGLLRESFAVWENTKDLQVIPAKPDLEDAFVYLMLRSEAKRSSANHD